ncbi:MAG: outer membrane lipoprotein-sorting protein [Bacteroidales bacterium]|nr:outer membrane lipoprotein-sorting protein [Bacteroidales bacterium]
MIKKLKKSLLLILPIALLALFLQGKTELTGLEIVTKANDLRYGETSVGGMDMTLVRPTWKRTISMKMWTKGTDYSMVIITAPAKEKGQVFMKRKMEMWNWIPKISRMIKLPPSTMSQGWMGSDFTNDDMMNEGSIVNKFSHKVLRSEKFENMDCYVIESTPNDDDDVVWGKKVLWISELDFFSLKTESYDEDMFLVKTEIASVIKQMGGKRLPSHFEIIPADDPGNKTIVVLKDIVFNEKIDDNFFSQQNMKRIR